MIDLMTIGAGTEPALEWVEKLTSRLPAAEAFAALEHQFGVLPLVEEFFTPGEALAEVTSGRKLGSLALFTPAPEPGWGAAAVQGEPVGGGLRLRGRVRIPGLSSGGSLVLARTGEAEHRLAWLDHDAVGVGRSGGVPCWLEIEGALAGAGLVSRPVTPVPGSDLFRLLEEYAGVWALAAATVARGEVHALRRAARTTSFNASQWVALGITEVEIETDLALAAAKRRLADGQSSGLAVATAAARALNAAAAKSAELRDQAGLESDGPLAGEAMRPLAVFLGGSLMLEAELARALGIRDTVEAGE